MENDMLNHEDIEKWLGARVKYEDESALIEVYNQMNRECSNNYSRAFWEFLRNAPCLEQFLIKVWKVKEKPVCVLRSACPWPGDIVIDNLCQSEDTLHEILHYAEENFSAQQDNQKRLFVILFDKDDKMHDLLLKEQYEPLQIDMGPLVYELNEDIEAAILPEGFTIHPLSEVYDFEQLNRLIWLGFHYDGEVPKISDDVQLSIKHAWLNYQKEYCSVILDTNGDYASYCGFWYDEVTQTAFLEPMITAERYHNMGLGKAVVKHSLQILKEKGCKKVFVEPDEEPFKYYKKIGFHEFEHARYYQKNL